jgi:hypothetical protein
MSWFNMVLTGLGWIFEAIFYTTDRMFDWLQAWFFWAWEYMWIYLVALWEGIGMPDLALPEIPSSYYAAFAMANQWVPLREGLLLVIVYFAFVLAITPARVIVRHLPVVGG